MSNQARSASFDTTPYERPGLTKADILEIKAEFDQYDRSQTGLINPKDLQESLSWLGSSAREESVYQVIMNLLAEGSGDVTFEKFVHLLTPRLLPQDSRANIGMVFELFDEHKTGFITMTTLQRVARELHIDISPDELDIMLEQADRDRDGFISQEDFYLLIAEQTRYN